MRITTPIVRLEILPLLLLLVLRLLVVEAAVLDPHLGEGADLLRLLRTITRRSPQIHRRLTRYRHLFLLIQAAIRSEVEVRMRIRVDSLARRRRNWLSKI